MRKLLIPLTFFFLIITSTFALTTFEINETEKLSLGISAEDPDTANLVYTFTEPLDEKGEWQTTYGDAGQYRSTITVSDGEDEVTEEILIIVNRKEEMPTLEHARPVENSIAIEEGESIEFSVEASDLNNDKLTYQWTVNGEIVSNEKDFLFEAGFEDSGNYEVNVAISDGIFPITRMWSVEVTDVNLESFLDRIEDVVIDEGQTAKLSLPNIRKYDLDYTISEPLGDSNKWKTDFDDSGEYTVKVTLSGKGFQEEKDVKIIVNNVDRKPKFTELRSQTIKENEELILVLNATDPDNDQLAYSVENIPEGASLSGNVFSWKPDFDYVQKSTFFDHILDRFRLLGKSTEVTFIAKGQELSDEKKIKITVKEKNRPFVFGPIDTIEVDEGQEITINPKYNDPDNDRLSFSFSGFMTRSTKKTDFDDSGSHMVKITGTDGLTEKTIFVDVIVNNVNRKPVFDEIRDQSVVEGEELKVLLSASDLDNDDVTYSATNLPEGAMIKNNAFIWTPEPGFTNKSSEDIVIDFTASDGEGSTMQSALITVVNKNKAPEIKDFSDDLIIFKDEPVLFAVDAIDGDGDDLTYEWDFGFLDKFGDGSAIERIYTSTGKKKVKVTVSDGVDSVSKIWGVEVV